MYRCITNIQVQQLPSTAWPLRKTVLFFDFVNDFEANDSWHNLTNKGKVVMPKNIYVRNETGKLISLTGTNVNIGGFSTSAPLLLRGDKVKIEAGYKYFNKAGKEITDTAVMFEGYISRVTSKKPIEFECEDNMWKLKQIPVATKTFSKTDSLEDILKYLVQGTGFTVNALTKTTFGAFTVGNETVAEVLSRLRKDFHFESYFRGNELRSGSLVYVPSEAITHIFKFQENVIADELEYTRKDDVVLSAIAHNTITERTGQTTKDGYAKTKKKRLEVLVTLANDKETVKVISRGEKVAENTQGERRTLFFPGATTTIELAKLALDELKKYYYNGLKGKFTAFGIPFVKQGDNVVLSDKELPERNGTYKVKEVEYSGGINGLRQTISLDYKIAV